ncbi:MAG: hypothetical protein OHK0022_22060 [Roseiflexaceae bacterium]
MSSGSSGPLDLGQDSARPDAKQVEKGRHPSLGGMLGSSSTWLRWIDGAQCATEMAQARAGELEQARLLEQARELS